MGRTACTEPQCLYKAVRYEYLNDYGAPLILLLLRFLSGTKLEVRASGFCKILVPSPTPLSSECVVT